jgi:peptidoglycan/LPS O-acetylase OafA/YrhL
MQPVAASSTHHQAGAARFHSLDALRAFALLLGVVFHAAESFEPGHLEWAIVDSDPSPLLHLFRHASHSFRMEIFFLLCGFFARLVCLKRGWRGFAWNRIGRILVPFVVGWFILYPLLVFLWLCGAAASGNWDAIGVPPEARGLAAWKLTVGFLLNGGIVQKFDLTHLWFLHQLMVLYLLALPLRAIALRLTPAAFPGWLDRLLASVVQSRARVLWLALPTIPMLLLMDGWSVDTPKSSLWPHAPTTVLYGWFFTLGWLFHRQPELLHGLGRGWTVHLALGLLLAWPTNAFGGWAWRAGLFREHAAELKLVHAIAYAFMMWGFVLACLGWFSSRFEGESKAWRYIADASYWVYLAHLPVVVALQVALGRVPWPWYVKFPLIVGMAFPFLFLSYHLLVRSTFIGRQLNGRTHPFRWPQLGRAGAK